MRILIDECIDRRLRDFLAGHECQTARYAGFGGLENGALLTAAENAKFDVLLTVDRGIEFQQDLRHRNIAILILCAKSIRLKNQLPRCRRSLGRSGGDTIPARQRGKSAPIGAELRGRKAGHIVFESATAFTPSGTELREYVGAYGQRRNRPGLPHCAAGREFESDEAQEEGRGSSA